MGKILIEASGLAMWSTPRQFQDLVSGPALPQDFTEVFKWTAWLMVGRIVALDRRSSLGIAHPNRASAVQSVCPLPRLFRGLKIPGSTPSLDTSSFGYWQINLAIFEQVKDKCRSPLRRAGTDVAKAQYRETRSQGLSRCGQTYQGFRINFC